MNAAGTVDRTPETTSPADVPCVDVLVDRAGRLGPLSYRVPENMELVAGDAVTVPFGRREAYGVVVGAGDAHKATRSVTARHGRRVSGSELRFAGLVADRYFCDLGTIACRLAPADGKGADPVPVGPVRLAGDLPDLAVPTTPRRRYVLCDPTVPMEVAAARAAAAAVAATGRQVLVLCPTVVSVSQVVGCFADGAVRLDSRSAAGEWKAFVTGAARVGVGTRRAALWSAAELGTIVVVDEQHPGHRESSQPYTNARELAAWRARDLDSDLILLGAAPSPMGLGAGVKVRPLPGPWPTVTVIDRADVDPLERSLPRRLRAALHRWDGPVVVVGDGCDPVWWCQRCRATDRAGDADGPGAATCPVCGADRRRLRRLDVDAVGRLAGQVQVVDAVRVSRLAPQNRLVVVAGFDAFVAAGTPDSDAQAARMVVDAVRAAGDGGHVLFYGRHVDHPLLQAVAARSLTSWARALWARVKTERLPPHSHLVTVTVNGPRPERSAVPGEVHGPRRRGRDWEVLIRVPADRLADVGAWVRQQRTVTGGRVRVRIDS